MVQSDSGLILIDCGFSLKYMLAALEVKGCKPEQLSAIVVTHEHGDHIKGVNTLAKRYSIPVYLTRGTLRADKIDTQKNIIHILQPDRTVDIAGITVQPVTVPHDAREPCQFVFTHAERTLGVLTDLGSLSSHVRQSFSACHALLLEANHDVSMLWAGPYPQSLKQRVIGDWGHLSNEQAADFMQHLSVLPETLVLGHISEKNNSLALVRKAFEGWESTLQRVIYASQQSGFDWLEV